MNKSVFSPGETFNHSCKEIHIYDCFGNYEGKKAAVQHQCKYCINRSQETSNYQEMSPRGEDKSCEDYCDPVLQQMSFQHATNFTDFFSDN